MPTLFVEVAVRAALVAAATALILWALRIRTAALRHAAWTTVVVVMLLLPIWSVAGPKLRLAVMPAVAVLPDSAAAPRGNSVTPAAAPTDAERAPMPEVAQPTSGFGRGTMLLGGLYALGALVLLARLALGTVQARRLRRSAVVRSGRATSARCATPITVGWLSPTLILPEGWERWPVERLDAVITHEHAHARRRDPLVQWLALLNRALFWFHPLAWWLERRLAGLAEEVCDAAVIRAGHAPQDYSDYLLDMARALKEQGRRLDVVGMAMPGSNLAHRMRRIFEEFPMAPLTRTRVFCTLALCAASSIVCAAAVLAPRPSSGAQPTAVTDAQIQTADITLEPEQGAPLSKPAGRAEPAVQPVPSATAQPATAPVSRVAAPAQIDRPDFSGHWTLVSSTTKASGVRGGTAPGLDPDSEVKTMSIWVSGAPVNCGPECTILQTARTLSVLLPENRQDHQTFSPPVVELNLEGSDSVVAFPSGQTYTVGTAWRGNQLVVTRKFACFNADCTFTQVLNVADGRLKVVTTFVDGYGVSGAPGTLTYAKQ